MHEREVIAVGHRMAGSRGVPTRGVVLKKHHGHVTAGPPAQPALGQVPFLRTLQHHDVDGLLGEPFRVDLLSRHRPLPRRSTAAAPRAALGQRRQEIAVRTLYECRGP